MSPFARHHYAEIIQDDLVEVQVETGPYSFDEFVELLKQSGLRHGSRSWQDYERGKGVIRSLELSLPSHTQYYQRYLGYLTDWVGV